MVEYVYRRLSEQYRLCQDFSSLGTSNPAGNDRVAAAVSQQSADRQPVHAVRIGQTLPDKTERHHQRRGLITGDFQMIAIAACAKMHQTKTHSPVGLTGARSGSDAASPSSEYSTSSAADVNGAPPKLAGSGRSVLKSHKGRMLWQMHRENPGRSPGCIKSWRITHHAVVVYFLVTANSPNND